MAARAWRSILETECRDILFIFNFNEKHCVVLICCVTYWFKQDTVDIHNSTDDKTYLQFLLSHVHERMGWRQSWVLDVSENYEPPLKYYSELVIDWSDTMVLVKCATILRNSHPGPVSIIIEYVSFLFSTNSNAHFLKLSYHLIPLSPNTADQKNRVDIDLLQNSRLITKGLYWIVISYHTALDQFMKYAFACRAY